MSTRERSNRVQHANDVIQAIGSHGRRFFYSENHKRFASFEIDPRGCLRYCDEYTGKSIKVVNGGKWRGFSNGGTCRAIIEALAHYIRTGDPIHPGHFGPWADWICGGDLWGYGPQEMEKTREKALASPAVWKKELAA